MPTAIYDNPLTQARELWQGGAIVCFLSVSAIEQGDTPGMPEEMRGLGAFKPGRIHGDATAVRTDRRHGLQGGPARI